MNVETYDHRDDRFASLIIGHAQVERLWTGGRWLEGPAYFRDAGVLVFSDIPNSRMLRWSEGLDGGGCVTVFRQPSRNANGNTMDFDGRLVTCEHATRRVTRTEKDGTITTIADRFDGRRFNSPNDVVARRDGTIWFSDPDYGIRTDYEGDRADPEMDGSHVYCADPEAGSVVRVTHDLVKPNGLAFSPDESVLYISDTGRGAGKGAPPHIRKFSVAPGNQLTDSGVFAALDNGVSDGFRLDERGNIWTSAGDGVHCLAPDGNLLGKVLIPERVSNVCFGGSKLNRLYITASTSLYAVFLGVRGCR